MHRTFRPESNRPAKAFTIVELLVAVSVTAILVSLMVSVTVNVLNAWNRSSAVLTTGNQARLILDQLSQDINGIVLKRGTDAMISATIQPTQTSTGDAAISTAVWSASAKPSSALSLNYNPLVSTGVDFADYRFGHAGVWLRFFTIPSDNSSTNTKDASAPRAVSYQMSRIKIGGTTSQQLGYVLYRADVRPNHDTASLQARSVFALGYDLAGANLYNNPTATNSGDSEPGSIRRPDASQIIGNDVIDFGVRFLERSSTGALVEVYPVDRRAASASGGFNRNFVASTIPAAAAASTSYGYPAVAEVLVRILSSEGVRLINAFEAGLVSRPAGFATDDAYWWELAEQNSKIFTRRIEIRSEAL
jgi:type II secretory pathway pseudopilin PulG